MSVLSMDALFEGRRVPRWLRGFERDPETAVADLLVGRADFGHLNAAEPSDLLLDWLHALGREFVEACDAALAAWIERAWGQPVRPSGSAAVVSVAWVTACDVIAGASGLTRAVATLRARFPAERHVLGALAEGRSRDPEGRAWLALARHQTDRSLLPEWWRLCSLPPNEPWYRGLYGIHGLQGLPLEAPTKGGGFSLEVAEGLRLVALALLAREDDGWLRPDDGQHEFVPLARLTIAAYPFPAQWRAFWDEVLRRERERAEALGLWLRAVDAGLLPRANHDHDARSTRRRGVRMGPDPSWVDQAKSIRQQLRAADGHDLQAAIELASRLVDAQHDYARTTRDAHYVVRSACSFAAAVRHEQPARALDWARLALEFEPWNPYAWTTSAECALALGHVDDAFDYALESARRFPDNVFARTGSAEVLKAKGDLDQAEAVYREAVQRFPDNVVARTGLAQLLRERERFDEATTLYRGVLEQATDTRSKTIASQGLAAMRRKSPRAVEGDTVPATTRVDSAWPAILRDASGTGAEAPIEGEPDAPASPRAEATQPTDAIGPTEPTLRATDVPHLLADAYILRRWGLRGDDAEGTTTGRLRLRARGVLAALQPRIEHDARVAGEAGLIELTLGELNEAATLLREAARRFPGSARVRYALARVERAQVRRMEGGLDNRRCVSEPWRRLARLDPHFRPVALLGEGRAWLELHNGNSAEDEARDAFGQLGHWLAQERPPAPGEHADRFVTWWRAEVQQYAFGDLTITRAEDLLDLGPLRTHVERNRAVLDRIEEELVDRLAAV